MHRYRLGLWPAGIPGAEYLGEGSQGRGEEAQSPDLTPLPHLRRLRERDAAAAAATGARPARPGPAAAAILCRGCPHLPRRGPSAARLPSSLRRLCRRCTALRPPPSPPRSLLLAPSSLRTTPLPSPNSAWRALYRTGVRCPARSLHQRTRGAAGRGVSGLSWVSSPGTSIGTCLLPHSTPPPPQSARPLETPLRTFSPGSGCPSPIPAPQHNWSLCG